MWSLSLLRKKNNNAKDRGVDLSKIINEISGPNVFIIPPPASELEKMPPELRGALFPQFAQKTSS